MAVERRTGAVVVVLLLAAAGVGVGAGALLGGSQATPGNAAVSSPLGTGSSATATPPMRTATKIPAPLPGAAPVPVYVLGETGAGPRLYREFRPASGTDAVAAALAGLAQPPADPDYRSPWVGVPARATRSGTTVTVTFTGAPDLGSTGAGMATQQVVYTVTAADPAVRQVRVVAPGLPAATATTRADQGSVLAPVWLLTPVDNGAAGRPMTVSGTASVFEATVSVSVRRGSTVVARTTATATQGAPGRGQWKASVMLPAGDYVVEAYEASEKDGSRVAVDSKRVTVSGP